MIIEQEKACQLSSQERYDVIARAMDAAEDEGFINEFVFIRALYVFTARALYPELVEQIDTDLLEGSPMLVWDKLLEDGVVDNMIKDYQTEVGMIAADGTTWFEDFMTFRNSARGVVDLLQTFTDSLAGGMEKQLAAFKADADIADVQAMAEKWGLNNAGGELATLLA